MQPPGGGQPPSERKGKLPPPFGGGLRPQTTTGAPPPTPAPPPVAPPAPAPIAAPPAPIAAPHAPATLGPPPARPMAAPPQATLAGPPPASPQPAKLPPAPSPPPPTVNPPPPAAASTAPGHAPGPSTVGPPSTSPRFPLPPPGPPQPAAAAAPFPDAIVPSLRPGQDLIELAQVSLKRAFRQRIDPAQVTLKERETLTRAGVTDPAMQGFLAWRRSVLFAFAALVVPLFILRAVEIFGGGYPEALRELDAVGTVKGLHTVLLLVEVGFCALCWYALRDWADWKKQRRLLTLGALAFFLAPFVIYLYPLRTTISMGDAEGDRAKAMGFLFGSLFSAQALLWVGPRAVALLAGAVRATTITKLLFPQSTAPGWLLTIAAPVCALVVFLVLLLPYQMTGSGFFVLAILGVLTALYFLTRTGLALTRPQSAPDVARLLQGARQAFYIALGIGGVFVIVGLAELTDQVDFKPLGVVNLILGYLTSTLVLTLVLTDELIARLELFAATPPPPAPPSS